MTKLQVKIGDQWEYVFCRNKVTGVVTTTNRKAALHGQAKAYFERYFANHEFREA